MSRKSNFFGINVGRFTFPIIILALDILILSVITFNGEFSWNIFFNLFLIVIFAVGICSIYSVLRNYQKEHRIKSLLKRVIKEPRSPIFCDIESLRKENILIDHNGNRGRELVIEQIAKSSIDTSEFTYQKYAGQFEGFTLITLYRVLNLIIKLFPSLEGIYPKEERFSLTVKIKNCPIREQLSFFEAMIKEISENEIRIQLYNLINEFNLIQLDQAWKEILLKLESLMNLSQAPEDYIFLKDLFLLTILIRNS